MAGKLEDYVPALRYGASLAATNVELVTTDKIEFRDTGIFINSPADGRITISADGTSTNDITLSGTVTLDDDLITPTSKKVQFRDSGLYINSGADGKLTISADGSGTDDITLSGTITLDDDLITPTTKKIQFRDSGIYINSGADGKLTISSDGSGTDDITLSGSVTGDADWLTTGGFSLGTNGTKVTRILTGTVSITPPDDAAAQSVGTATAAVTNLTTAGHLVVNALSAVTATAVIVAGRCTTAGEILVTFANISSTVSSPVAAIDVAYYHLQV